MPRTRRTSLDSVAGVSRLHAIQRPTWPEVVPLPENENRRVDVLARFTGYLEYRAADEWSPSDLLLLAKLARISALHDECLDSLERDGLTSLGGKSGTALIKNPLVEACGNFNSQQLALMRSLHLFNDADPRSLALHGRKSREIDGQNQARAKSGLESLLA